MLARAVPRRPERQRGGAAKQVARAHRPSARDRSRRRLGRRARGGRRGRGDGDRPRAGLGLLAVRGRRAPAGPRRRARAARTLARATARSAAATAGSSCPRRSRRRCGATATPASTCTRRSPRWASRTCGARPTGWTPCEDAGAAGLPLASALGRELRGAGYGEDLEVFLATGSRLLVFEDRAVVCAREGQRPAAARARRRGGVARPLGRAHDRPAGLDGARVLHRAPRSSGRSASRSMRGCRSRPTARCASRAASGRSRRSCPSGAWL